MGEADVEGDVGVMVVVLLLLLRDDWAASIGRVDWFEKTVRSFWRERAGERRREGMVAVVWCGVEMVVFGVYGSGSGDESLYVVSPKSFCCV